MIHIDRRPSSIVDCMTQRIRIASSHFGRDCLLYCDCFSEIPVRNLLRNSDHRTIKRNPMCNISAKLLFRSNHILTSRSTFAALLPFVPRYCAFSTNPKLPCPRTCAMRRLVRTHSGSPSHKLLLIQNTSGGDANTSSDDLIM